MRKFFSNFLSKINNFKFFFNNLLKILFDRRARNFLLLFLFLYSINFLFKNYSFNFFDFYWINFFALFLGYGVIIFWSEKQDVFYKIFKFCIFFISLKTIAIVNFYSIFIIFFLILLINNITSKRLELFFNNYICWSPLIFKLVSYICIYNFLEVLFCYGFGFKFVTFVGLILSFFITLL